MFEDLQEEMGLTYLFIAHDLSVVKHISDRIGVMYLGRMVELADSYELTTHPVHPYTKSLISAIPDRRSKDRENKQTYCFGRGCTKSVESTFRMSFPYQMPICHRTVCAGSS